MDKQKKETVKQRKNKVMSFRVPYELFELYEQKCIEEQIRMSENFQSAFTDFLKRRNLNALSER